MEKIEILKKKKKKIKTEMYKQTNLHNSTLIYRHTDLENIFTGT